jgi:DNA-binding response OmpR family regulator
MPTHAQSVVRILLVEDEPKLRKSLMEGLRLEEWSVTGAASREEARQLLDRENYDLVVLDWMLPDGDGLEIVRRLRDQGNPLPVLIITARAGVSDEAIIRQAGATDYLPKPFSFDDLLERTRRLLSVAS